MFHLESGPHWAVRGYHTFDGLELLGRKDRATLGRDYAAWMQHPRTLPDAFNIPDEPRYLRDADRYHQIAGRADTDAYTLAPWQPVASSIPSPSQVKHVQRVDDVTGHSRSQG